MKIVSQSSKINSQLHCYEFYRRQKSIQSNPRVHGPTQFPKKQKQTLKDIWSKEGYNLVIAPSEKKETKEEKVERELEFEQVASGGRNTCHEYSEKTCGDKGMGNKRAVSVHPSRLISTGSTYRLSRGGEGRTSSASNHPHTSKIWALRFPLIRKWAKYREYCM